MIRFIIFKAVNKNYIHIYEEKMRDTKIPHKCMIPESYMIIDNIC